MGINGLNGVNYSAPTQGAGALGSKKELTPDDYTARLQSASTSYNDAKEGQDYVSKIPNGDLTVRHKNMMGDYGTIYKTDGSVVVNACPACGGPKQILPQGSIDPKVIKDMGDKIQ